MWNYEVEDPSFRPKYTCRQGETDVRGWRPLASIWYADAEPGLPWRAIIEPDGPRSPRFDYQDLEAAKVDIVRRLGAI